MEHKSPINPLHYKYIIFILVLFIVVLIVFFFTTDKTLVDFVSFGATLSSLILAVLAIIQGFVSNNSINDTVSELRQSSNDVSDNAQKLTAIMTEFDRKFNEIPEQIAVINKNLELREFSKPNNLDDKNKIQLTEEQVSSILTHASALTRLSLYIAYKSYTSGKFFDVLNVIAGRDDKNYYLIATLQAFESINLFRIANDGIRYSVIEWNKLVTPYVDKYEDHVSGYDDDGLKAEMLSDKKEIDRIFDQP